MTTSRNRYTYSNSLITGTPTILHSQFYSTSILGRSHIQINHIITLRKQIIATCHNKELRPSSCWNKMDSTIHNRWFTSHSKEWERSISIGLLMNFIFYIYSTRTSYITNLIVDPYPRRFGPVRNIIFIKGRVDYKIMVRALFLQYKIIKIESTANLSEAETHMVNICIWREREFIVNSTFSNSK